jgi:hypothetical protein
LHGIVHLDLQRYVVATYGEANWKELTRRAGLEGEIYTPLRSYPDEQLLRLVKEASALVGLDPQALLESFAEFVAPRFLRLYEKMLEPHWRTLDIIEHTEDTIHRVVRMREPGALPPRLNTVRSSPNEVILTYSSPRRLCAVARGIARGIARVYDEHLVVQETVCMLKGAKACVISFKTEDGKP